MQTLAAVTLLFGCSPSALAPPDDIPADTVPTDTVEPVDTHGPGIDTPNTDDDYVYGVRSPHNWPDPWPLAPSCTFPAGMVAAPGPGLRSLNFHAPDANRLFSMYAADLDGDGAGELLAQMGNPDGTGRLSAYSLVFDGLLDEVGVEILRTAPAPGWAATVQTGPADLDGDGVLDLVFHQMDFDNSGVFISHCAGVSADPEQAERWLLHPSEGATNVKNYTPDDIDGDLAVDLLVVQGIDLVGTRFEGYRGPFRDGEIIPTQRMFEVNLDGIGDAGLGEARMGDFNGDGTPDLVVSWTNFVPPYSGHVRIFFGPVAGAVAVGDADVRLDSTRSPDYASITRMLPPDDLDGDGSDDLILMGADDTHDRQQETGAVYIFKGPFTSGERWRDIDADSILRWPMPGARLGLRWAWLGDVDGDQRPEFAVTALGSRSNPPPGVDLTVDWPAGAAQGPSGVEGAILVFGNTPPGVVGPEQAKFIVMGEDAGDVAGFWVMAGPGDVSGDGLGDLAYSTSPYGDGLYVNVLHPCEDFGVRGP